MDAARVFTLKLTADGMGGDLYRIDLDGKTAMSLGTSLRDIGLFPNGKAVLLRERLAAAKVQTSAGVSWYRREKYCFSLDGITYFDAAGGVSGTTGCNAPGRTSLAFPVSCR